jgi:hypothetical protein
LSFATHVVQEGGDGAPHPVFQLSLEDVSAGKGVEAARQSGWRFLMGQASTQGGTAGEVHGAGPAYEFGGISHGAHVGQMVETLQRAERLREVADGEFELRLLRVPALYVVAVWLKDQRAANDLLIPIPPTRPPLVVGQPYTTADFERVLKQVAGERKAAPTAPPGQQAPPAP